MDEAVKDTFDCDVLVIGSGGAGLRAAIAAAENGSKTIVLSKGKANRSGATLLAGANISGDIGCDGKSLWELGFKDANPNDSKEKWFQDIIIESFYLANPDLVRKYVEDAPGRLRELIDWGVKVKGLEGERGVSVLGTSILDSLYKRAKALGVKFFEDELAAEILLDQGEPLGVISFEIPKGNFVFYRASSIVLATGGMHSVFPFHSGSSDLSGDGQALALRAGAELIDMEMVSFCPNVIKFPLKYRGNILPYILQSFGYGEVLNASGENFLSDFYDKDLTFLALNTEWNKLLLSFAFHNEISRGKGVQGNGLLYTIKSPAPPVFEKLYKEIPELKKAIFREILSILEKGQALVVSPGAHYFEGGIKINSNMETSLPGIFAAGECAGGLFGANRVSSALTEMLVEGAVAGENASFYAQKRGQKRPEVKSAALNEKVEPLLKPFQARRGQSVLELKNYLHDLTYKYLWVSRDGHGLSMALDAMTNLARDSLNEICLKNKSPNYNKEWLDFLELRNMVYCACAMAKSALLRKESRGVHIRQDCFFIDNENWLKHILIIGDSLVSREEDVVREKMKISPNRIPYMEFLKDLVKSLS
jgi:succinate dehydrogenase/fumarate reductase flavoprotein subunit